MQQRVVIAMALAAEPRVLVADEPTTALDVTVQAQILRLLKRLRDQTGTAVLLITHDLGVVAETADRVVVMYHGRIVEQAPVQELFNRPLHPYTEALFRAVPRIETFDRDLVGIPGQVPPASAPDLGCAFVNRCPRAEDACRGTIPDLVEAGPGHSVRCPPAVADWSLSGKV
jgi:peptide/nickel transport system ATP-binding protein